jgi:hypothetical protein
MTAARSATSLPGFRVRGRRRETDVLFALALAGMAGPSALLADDALLLEALDQGHPARSLSSWGEPHPRCAGWRGVHGRSSATLEPLVCGGHRDAGVPGCEELLQKRRPSASAPR